MSLNILPRFLVMLSVVGLACGDPGETRPGDGPREPSLLILVLDACRADKLGCYGYERPTSPVIDSIAADPDATLFRHYYVQASWTKPSTASLFTGLFVHQHGVLIGHERRGTTSGAAVFATQALSEEFNTMAELFSEAGFHTFSVVGHRHLAEDYGFDQGFSEYLRRRHFSDEDKVEALLSKVEGTPGRFFGYVHLRGCHNPFRPKERDAEFMEQFTFDYDEEGRGAFGVDFNDTEIKFAIRERKVTLDEDDVRFLRLIYDAKLRKVDRDYVKPVVEGLKKLGRYDDTLLIITADHGEALYEHQDYAHKGHLSETIVHVPLIVKFPHGRKPAALGGEVGALTRSIDLLPSLLAYFGRPVPEDLPGVQIFEGAEPDFSLAERNGSWALLRDGFKLIRTTALVQLFDLTADPGEQSNLAEEMPVRVLRMKKFAAEVFAHRGDRPVSPNVETPLDEETLEDLRSLGYVR